MFTPQSLFWYLPLYKLHWHGRIIHNFKIADDLLCGVETKWSSMGNGKIKTFFLLFFIGCTIYASMREKKLSINLDRGKQIENDVL